MWRRVVWYVPSFWRNLPLPHSTVHIPHSTLVTFCKTIKLPISRRFGPRFSHKQRNLKIFGYLQQDSWQFGTRATTTSNRQTYLTRGYQPGTAHDSRRSSPQKHNFNNPFHFVYCAAVCCASDATGFSSSRFNKNPLSIACSLTFSVSLLMNFI
jgi:hypothetical protein